MKNLLLVLLLLPSVVFGALAADKQDLPQINLLQNVGFENGQAKWKKSAGGTWAVVTSGSNLLVDSASLTFDAAASADYVESALYLVPESLKGKPCLASIEQKGADSNLELRVLDGSNVVLAQIGLASSNKINFNCPSSGSIKLRIHATGNAALVALDKAHLGSSTELFQVSQANHKGTLKYAFAANCAWSVTSATYASFSADTDCSSPSVTGVLSAPATKIPAFKMDVIAGNVYRVTAKGMFNATTGYNSFRFSDGTDATDLAGGAFGTTGVVEENSGIISAIYKPTTSGLKTIEIQAKGPNGNDSTIEASTAAGEVDLVFEVEEYPSQNQVVVSSINTNLDWMDGGAVVITATTSNPTKGTTTTDKFWWKKVGEDGDFRMEFLETTDGTAGSGDYLFALPAGLQIDTGKITPNSTVVGNASAFSMTGVVGTCTVSSLDAASALSGVVVVYDSTHVRCVGTDQSQPGAIGSGFYGLDFKPSFMMSFRAPILGWKGSVVNMPVVASDVASGMAGVLRIEYASVSSAGVVSNESSDWVNGNASVSDTSLYTFTLNSSWSATPICFATTNSTGSFDAYPVIDSVSPTSILVRTGNHLPGTAQVKVAREFSLLCMGPR